MTDFPSSGPPVVAVSRAADIGDVLRMLGGSGGGGFGSLASYAPGYQASAHYMERPVLSDAQRQEAWIFAAIDLGAFAVSMVEERFYSGDPTDPNSTEITGGPVVDLFRQPNDRLDSAFLRVCDFQSEIMTGESFWFMEGRDGESVNVIGDGRNARIDLPSAIWPVPGSMVRAIANKEQTGLEAWEAPALNGKRIQYPEEAVIQFMHRPDDQRPFRGIGPMAVAWGYASQNHLARRFSSNLLKNDGRVGGIIVVGGFLPKHERTRLEREAEDRWDGPENAGSTRILEGPNAKFQETNRSPRDLEYGELLRVNKEEIAAVLQTPGALFGLDTSNYATFAGHLRRYVSMRIEPWLDKRARRLNAGLFGRLRGAGLNKIRIAYDTERLWRIIGDMAQQAGTVRSLVQSGVPLDDALQQAGVKTEPIPGGEVAMVNTSQVPLISAQSRGRALALKAQAEAASALINAGADPLAAFQLAEIPIIPVAPDPEEEEEESEEPSEEAEGASGDDEKGLPAPASGVRRSSDAEIALGRKSWESVEKLRRPRRRELDRSLKSIFFRMRKEQLAALATFAETGQAPTMERAVGGNLSTPYMAEATARALIKAVEDDAREAAELEEKGESKQVFRDGCDGQLVAEAVPHTPNFGRWRRAHQRLSWGVVDGQRLLDVARLRLWSTKITENELDALVTAGALKWRDALAEKIGEASVTTFQTAAREMVAQWDGTSIAAEDPEILRALRQKAIKVAEGTQSVLATRIRSELLKVLTAESTGGNDLQAAVRDSLKALKASTTKAFSSHSARALTIARTEVGGATSSAQFEEIRAAWQDGIIKGYAWATSGRARAPEGTVRASHFALEGVKSTPDLGFVSPITGARALHPHGFGVAAEDINCECSLVAIVDDDEDDA